MSLAPDGAAGRNSRRILDLEQAWHIAPEHSLNNLLYSAPRWLSVASAYYYETLHYALTAATLIWLYRLGPAAYRRARTWLVSMTLPALVVFWLFPVAPPRTVPGAAAHDIVAEQHSYGWWGAGGGTAPRGLASLVDENAAMPSLHVGWALWVGWNLVHSARNPFVRAFGFVYPVLTILVVLSTGNHYLLDVLAGALLAFVAKMAVDKVDSLVRPRTRPRVSPCPAMAFTRTHGGNVPHPSDRLPGTRSSAWVRENRVRHASDDRLGVDPGPHHRRRGAAPTRPKARGGRCSRVRTTGRTDQRPRRAH